MKLLCKLVGHRPVEGWCGSPPYLKIVGSVIDGIGQEHAFLSVECERCGEEFRIGNVHVPKAWRSSKSNNRDQESR